MRHQASEETSRRDALTGRMRDVRRAVVALRARWMPSAAKAARTRFKRRVVASATTIDSVSRVLFIVERFANLPIRMSSRVS